MRISYTSKKEAYADLLHIKNYSTPAFNVFVSSREQKEESKLMEPLTKNFMISRIPPLQYAVEAPHTNTLLFCSFQMHHIRLTSFCATLLLFSPVLPHLPSNDTHLCC